MPRPSRSTCGHCASGNSNWGRASRVATSSTDLAILYYRQGKYAEAEPLYQRALHIREQQLGPEHPEVAYRSTDWQLSINEQGKYAEAEPLYQRALHIREQQLGPEHPEMANLSTDWQSSTIAGQVCRGGATLPASLAHQGTAVGTRASPCGLSTHWTGDLYREQGKYAEAEPLYQRALRIREQQLGPEHPDVASPLNGLAILY